MMKQEQKQSPIEVWLTKRNLEITCRVVYEDESDSALDVDSLSMRGAQREMTAWLVGRGYKPVGRWETEAADDEGDALETVRTFKLASATGPVVDQVRSIVNQATTPLPLSSTQPPSSV